MNTAYAIANIRFLKRSSKSWERLLIALQRGPGKKSRLINVTSGGVLWDGQGSHWNSSPPHAIHLQRLKRAVSIITGYNSSPRLYSTESLEDEGCPSIAVMLILKSRTFYYQITFSFKTADLVLLALTVCNKTPWRLWKCQRITLEHIGKAFPNIRSLISTGLGMARA